MAWLNGADADEADLDGNDRMILVPMEWACPGFVDTRLSGVEDVAFKLGGRAVAEGGMSTLPIVPDLDELKQRPACMCPALEALVAEQLLRQGGKETLDHRIVPAVAESTHARREPGRREQLAIRPARILHAPIRMMQAAAGAALRESHLQRAEREFLLEPPACVVASRVMVHTVAWVFASVIQP